MVYSPHQLIGMSFMLLVACLALWKGGLPERIAGPTMLVAATISSFSADYRWIEPQYAIMTIDVTMLLFLVILALKADRWWPIWGAGLQLLGIVIHGAFAAQQLVVSRAYMFALNIIGYLVVGSLLVGTIAYMIRKRKAAAVG